MQNSKSLRLIELFLLLAVAFGSEIFYSVAIQVTGYEIPPNSNTEYAMLRWGSFIISELAAIFLLVYILFRQGRNLSTIGFAFSWKDFPISILLAITAFIAVIVCWIITYYVHYFITGSILNDTIKNIDLLKTGISFLSSCAMFINPFYEELIIRAYTISEVKSLTGDGKLAIFFSVVFQCTYHLYQSFLSAWLLAPMFLTFSLYYVKWKRILPVILAHMYFDFIALFSYSG